MKTRLPHIALTLLLGMLAAGCAREERPLKAGDPVRVQFILPGSYSLPAPTRPAGPKSRTAEPHPDLKPEMLQELEDGSTLWLAVYEKPRDGSDYDETPDALRSYVVRRLANYTMLYTCTVDKDGNVISEEDAPLYLEVGKTYKFRAISPARELIDREKLHVRNGDYLLATDDRYTQTASKELTVGKDDGGTPGMTYVRLNPLLQQTAQIRFNIEPGENVHHLDILPAGIDVSGIQDDVLHENLYNWTTSEPLHMYLGSKHSRITIKEFTKDEHGCISGQTAVLPTDAVSNSIVVLLNLGVNGINSQYTMVLSGMMLEAAHSYNFDIAVKVQDDVTVAVWQNQTWDHDLELKQSNQKNR